ncbi:MAG: helix-turn-helix domain-containing protein [Aureispira sp.]
MIFTAGITIALFIAVLLLVKKEKSNSDLLLCLWMLLYAFHIALFYVLNNNTIYHYPSLLGLHFPLPLLHGVFLYLYVSSVTNQHPIKKVVVFIHLIPTILTFLYLIPFMGLPAAEKIEIFEKEGQGYEMFQFILLIAICISGVYYVWRSNEILKQHQKQILNRFANLEKIDLQWLQFLTYGLGLVWILVIITQKNEVIFLGVSIFVILIGFFGIQQKTIFDSDKEPSKNILTTPPILLMEPTPLPKEKYTRSGLSDKEAGEQYQNLITLMQEESYYKESTLSLSQLASKLNIHPNYLSQIINEREGISFYDFVNKFRVEEFKRLVALPDNRQFTLITLAYECGFNSKSSFNRYFKKITGQTPSQYAKLMME